MYIAVLILLFVLVLFVLLLLAPLRIRLFFSHFNGKTDFTVYAGLGFLQVNLSKLLKRKKNEKPKEQKETTPEKKKLSMKDVENGFLKGVEALRYLKKKFTVKLFSIRIRMGLGDAADTGIATGAGYATIYGILGKIDRYFILKKHEVSIIPVFQGMGLEMEFRGECILRLIYCLGLIQKIRKEDET